MTYDITSPIIRRLSEERCKIIEKALRAACPETLTNDEERREWLEGMRTEIQQDEHGGTERVFVAGVEILNIKLTVTNKQDGGTFIGWHGQAIGITAVKATDIMKTNWLFP